MTIAPENADEISGDGGMVAVDRLRYFVRNLRRNLQGGQAGVPVESYCARREPSTPPLGSPSRVLMESFLLRRLPMLLPPGPVRVLDIGCGGGGLCALLARAGYSGLYHGIDIDDRFDRAPQPGFEKNFTRIDAHDFSPDAPYDLVVSNSALEHIPDDVRFTHRLGGMTAARGLQLHFVPGGWALPIYLWHGYRQYTLPAIAARFGSAGVTAFRFGGLPSLLLHFGFVTLGEMLLPLRARARLPGLYARLLDGALGLDRLAPFAAPFHAVVVRSPPASS